MATVTALKPEEVVKARKESLPNAALEAFNQLITENFNGHGATVYQKDVVALMVEKGLDRDEIYQRGWLDVEDIYRQAGWKVIYDKPGYNENYEAFFTFSKK